MHRITLTSLLIASLLLTSFILAAADKAPRSASLHIHYIDSDPGGADEAIVLIHGWASDHTFLNAQFDGLKDRARVLAIDLPGHGRSSAPDIRYTMDLFADGIALALEDANVNKAVLIGHSNGVPTVRQFARRYPDRTLALVGIDGQFVNIFPKELMEPFLEQMNSEDYMEAMNRFAGPMLDMSPMSADQKMHVRHVMFNTPQHVLVGAMLAGADEEIWIDDRLEVPTLVVNANNPMYPQTYLDAVRALGDDVEIHVWDDVSHMLMMEQPERFNTLVTKFLDRRSLLTETDAE